MDLIQGHQVPSKAHQEIVKQEECSHKTIFSPGPYSDMKRRPISEGFSEWQGKDNALKMNRMCLEGVFQES